MTDQLAALAVLADQAAAAMGRRDAAIVAASRAGASLREIAAVVGISHMAVRRIILARDA